MPSPAHGRRLTATDASFLYLERRSIPMQIGSLSILEGDMTYDEFVANLAPRLAKIPRFRQRAVPAPFNLGHPTWEYDPEFNIHNHLSVITLEAPGTHDQLREAVAPIHSRRLNRDRPLWEIHLIRGLEGGRCALVTAVHHAMVDGVGSNELMALLYDIQPRPVLPEEKPFNPPPIPDAEDRIVDAVWDSASTAVDAWAEYTQSMVKTAKEWQSDEARATRGNFRNALPQLSSPLRRLPFNRRCSGRKHFAWSEFSFAEARAIRGEIGVTVNDVVLTVLSGAIARYAEKHGQSTRRRTMKVMVPVSVRPKDASAALGNLVSALPVTLPLGEKDPIKRAYRVSKAMADLKNSGLADEFHRLSDLIGGIVPPATQAALGRMVFPPRPPFNIVCTNVPGPQIPLYFAGRRLVSYLPIVPTGFDMGVGVPVYTYNQRLAMGLSADMRACPDVTDLNDFLQESFTELRLAAGVPEIDFIDIIPRKGPVAIQIPISETLPDREPERKTPASKSPKRKKAPQKKAKVEEIIVVAE